MKHQFWSSPHWEADYLKLPFSEDLDFFPLVFRIESIRMAGEKAHHCWHLSCCLVWDAPGVLEGLLKPIESIFNFLMLETEKTALYIFAWSVKEGEWSFSSFFIYCVFCIKKSSSLLFILRNCSKWNAQRLADFPQMIMNISFISGFGSAVEYLIVSKQACITDT